eukprot:c29325_g1_i2 orf=411-3923(-)
MDAGRLHSPIATLSVGYSPRCCWNRPATCGQRHVFSPGWWKRNLVGHKLQRKKILLQAVRHRGRRRKDVVANASLLSDIAAVVIAAAVAVVPVCWYYLHRRLPLGSSATSSSTMTPPSLPIRIEAALETMGLLFSAIIPKRLLRLLNYLSSLVQLQSYSVFVRTGEASGNDHNEIRDRIVKIEGESRLTKSGVLKPTAISFSSISGLVQQDAHQAEGVTGNFTPMGDRFLFGSELSGNLVDKANGGWNMDELDTKENDLESALYTVGSRKMKIEGYHTEEFTSPRTTEVLEFDSSLNTKDCGLRTSDGMASSAESDRERLDALILQVPPDTTFKSPSPSPGDGTSIAASESIDLDGRVNGYGSLATCVTIRERLPGEQAIFSSSLSSKRVNGTASGLSSTLKTFKRRVQESNDLDSELSKKLDDLYSNRSEDPKRYISLYHKLLNAGRLQDCVYLLEQMNQVAILDMTKLFHSKFFHACKRNQAVKEAFRFLQLIGTPSLSSYNLFLSVCLAAKDVDGAFQAFSSLKQVNLKADSMLYTTLISICAKSGKVDLFFKVFHEMVNSGIEPTLHTYGALIDGCARAGQVGKAFGIYGIMKSKKVKPDRVIFNSLITACGHSGAIERAFDIFSEMKAEPIPVNPDHVTFGALINACTHVGQMERGLQVYKMMEEEGIKGTVEVYTEAVHACSQEGNLDAAFAIYTDMKKNLVQPDEVFFSALIDVAGHANQIDVAFKILNEMNQEGLKPGVTVYSAVMGACSNTRSWERALDVYRDIKAAGLSPTVSTFNALITSLCQADQLQESLKILQEMRQDGRSPNQITYAVLIEACKKASDIELAYDLYTKSVSESMVPSAEMCERIIGLCLKKIQLTSSAAQFALPFHSFHGSVCYEKWVSWAVCVYREALAMGAIPTSNTFSEVLGCLRLPMHSHRNSFDGAILFPDYESTQRKTLRDGFGIYNPQALTLFEEAASLGIVPCFSYTDGPIVVHTETMPVYVAEVCLLTLFKQFKHQHDSGARLSPVNIYLPVEKKKIAIPNKGQRTIDVASRNGQAVAALLRRLGMMSFRGHESSGKIRIPAAVIKKWLSPESEIQEYKLPQFQINYQSFPTILSRRITEQQRRIRLGEGQQCSTDITLQHSYSCNSIGKHRMKINHAYSSGSYRTDGLKEKDIFGA